MANDVAVKVIANITRTSTGPEYEEAIETGAKYWDSVLAGRPDPAAKEAADRALSSSWDAEQRSPAGNIPGKKRF